MTTREAFLERIRVRQAPPPSLGPHPPPTNVELPVRYKALDGVEAQASALAPIFVAAARSAGASVDEVDAAGVPAAVLRFARSHDVRTAVATAEPGTRTARSALFDAGIRVADHDPIVAAGTDLGVTGAVAGVAATGSVVLAADRSGGRGASVLPRTHVCILDTEQLVPTTAEVWERWRSGLPSNLTMVTGPSRTGDIEQILTIGVHGPVALHIVLVSRGDDL